MTRISTRVGQESEADPADAAGQAALEEAQNAKWPPEKSDAETVGAAAGGAAAAAACTAYGAAAVAPLCAAIGSEVGEFVGGVFYDLADSFFGASDLTRRNLDRIRREERMTAETVAAGERLAVLHKQAEHDWPYSGSYATNIEIRAMREKYKLPVGRGYTWSLWTDDQLTAQLRRLAAAESGRAAELIALKNINYPPSSGAVKVVLGAGIIGGLWLLAKLF